jgi:hypothetical protein
MTPKLLDELRSAVSEPESAEAIVRALLSKYGISTNASEAVGSVMEILETIAESDAELGCCLMAHLWGTASQIEGAFDITDAIDLWLADTNTNRLEAQIRYLAKNSREPYIAEYFKGVIR